MKLLIALTIVTIATLIVAYKEDEGDYLKDVIKSLSKEDKMKIMEDALDELNESEDYENIQQKDPKPFFWNRRQRRRQHAPHGK